MMEYLSTTKVDGLDGMLQLEQWQANMKIMQYFQDT